MKKELKLRDKLCIYGDDYAILSEECYGCYNYGYICCGPEFGNCPGGIFEKDKYVAYSEYILQNKAEFNSYLFARLIGETKKNLIEHLNYLNNELSKDINGEYHSHYQKMISDMENALDYSDEKIECLKKELGLDLSLSELEPIINKIIAEEETAIYEDCNTSCNDGDNQDFSNNSLKTEGLLHEDEMPF